MKKIVVANQKGGIGKTTTALAISSLLEGRTLFIDSDVQGNSSDTYHAKYENVGTLYDLLFDDKCPVEDVIQHTDVGDIIGSDPLLRDAEDKLRSMVGSEFVLAERLEGLDYDYCVIDTAPAMNQLLVTALYCADELVIPVTADRYSMQGLSQLFRTLELLEKRYKKKVNVAGFLLVRNDERTVLSKEIRVVLSSLAEKYNTKVFERSIRECVDVKKAQTAKELLLSYSPFCNASMDYKAFIREWGV